MWRHRLLTESSSEGSAPVEFVFGALFACVLLFGVFEVAFALYGRNVLASSAHEAARAAIELGGTSADADAIARDTIERAAGGLVSGYDVAVATGRTDERLVVRVRVIGRLDAPGPLPIHLPVDLTATATREVPP
jgi:Flp pilus assembly protein TadG